MPGQEKIIKYEGSLCGCLASAHPAKDPSQLRCCQFRNQTAPPHEPDTEQKDCRPIPERMVPAAVTRVNASNRAPPCRRHLKHGYRDNRRGHYYKHDGVLICAHVGTGALRAGNPVRIGKDGGKINPSVNSSAY